MDSICGAHLDIVAAVEDTVFAEQPVPKDPPLVQLIRHWIRVLLTEEKKEQDYGMGAKW